MSQIDFSYKIKRYSKAKTLKIFVHIDGQVVITAPKSYSLIKIKNFIEENHKFIKTKLEQINNKDGDLANFSKKHFLNNKLKAKKILSGKVQFWSKFYSVDYKEIFIKSTKTCWGSCSSKKNLNFNYKLIFLPEKLQEYIVVHEICHLIEMNHSPRFWNLVAKAIPDYKICIKQLKKFR